MEFTKFEATEAESRTRAMNQLEHTLHRNIELDQDRLLNSRRIAAADKSLNARRLLSDSDALKTRSEADAIESSLGNKHVELQELNSQRIQDQYSHLHDKLKRGLAIQAARIKLGLLNDRLERDTRIVSAYSGKVVDLMMTPHALIEKAAPPPPCGRSSAAICRWRQKCSSRPEWASESALAILSRFLPIQPGGMSTAIFAAWFRQSRKSLPRRWRCSQT